jgi:hypothetical protein
MLIEMAKTWEALAVAREKRLAKEDKPDHDLCPLAGKMILLAAMSLVSSRSASWFHRAPGTFAGNEALGSHART